MRKPASCICENKDAGQLRGNRELISAFVFATRIVQALYYLNTKVQGSSHLLLLYRPVCVRPGRKPRKPVFSHEAHIIQFAVIVSEELRALFQVKCKHVILLTCPCNEDPLTHYFYIVKSGFT